MAVNRMRLLKKVYIPLSHLATGARKLSRKALIWGSRKIFGVTFGRKLREERSNWR
jgi:hypothetical protein